MQNNLPTEITTAPPPSLAQAQMMYYPDYVEQTSDLRDYWHILRKRKWWLLSVFLLVVGLTAARTFTMTPIYEGATTLQIIQDNPSALLGGSAVDPLAAMSGTSQLDRFYQTQYDILQSPEIAYGLIDSLNLTEHPSYKNLQERSKDTTPELIRRQYAAGLLANLKIEPVRNSFLVKISFSSPDKELARRVPEAIQTEYLKLSMSTRQQSYTMLREWLDGELVTQGKKLEISERNLYEDGQKKDFLTLEDPSVNVTIQKYVDVSRLLTTAQAEKGAKEAQYRQISEKGLDAPPVINNPLIQQLRQQLIDLESQVSGSSKIFGSNYPEHQAQNAKLKELRERLGQEIKRLEAGIKADYQAASRAEALVQNEYETAKAKIIDMQENLVGHHILKRDLQTNQTLYEALLARMKEASVASTMIASNVAVIRRAETPHLPIKPQPVKYMALALIIGAMAGIAAALFIEYLDSSIKTTEEMERLLHIAVLGVVPLADSKELQSQTGPLDLITHNDSRSMVSEAVFHIRTAIMLSASAAPPRVITITSANPQEGKSTISSNIAAVLATKDRKCLLMDCDLRKPRLHRVFGMSNKCGLTNYLTGNASLEEVIRPTVVPNLYFIPGGPNPPNPNELFASTAFKELMEKMRLEFDHIVIDSPPVIGFADARSISGHTDGVVLVIRHHETTREAGRLALQLLSQNNCRVLGSVLSMARADRLGYGGYYGYYRYYHKYYSGYHESDNGNKNKQVTDS